MFQELKSRKTEELYLSVQRAKEEAQKHKHLQRIQNLARKGHDVSNLLRSLEGEAASQGKNTKYLLITKCQNKVSVLSNI